MAWSTVGRGARRLIILLSMAELIATGRVPPLIAPFALDRFRNDRGISERASAGTH